MVQHWLSGLQLSFMEVKYSFGLLKTDLKSFPPSQLSASVLEDELAKKKTQKNPHWLELNSFYALIHYSLFYVCN